MDYLSARSHQRKRLRVNLITDPREVARVAGLRYVGDGEPGIRRQRRGKGFSYVGPDGQRITDRETLARIKTLVVPPGWTDVWICPDPDGHIQVTARDSKGRKQYRYHPRWQQVTEQTKFDRMILFGEHLPRLRQRINEDLNRRGLPREKVLAAVVALLGSTFIRVGNPEYARNNESYGLTTMQDDHVAINGSTIHFEFRGKSGKAHEARLRDRRLASIVKHCRDVPGQHLFQYYDENGNSHAVTSSDVNEYLREITGQPFTAKDFRTWGGTVLAVASLAAMSPFENQAQLKKNLVAMYKAVAGQLGNTVAVCKKYYVHPAVIHLYEGGALPDWLASHSAGQVNGGGGLDDCEHAVLALLQAGLAEQQINAKAG